MRLGEAADFSGELTAIHGENNQQSDDGPKRDLVGDVADSQAGKREILREGIPRQGGITASNGKCSEAAVRDHTFLRGSHKLTLTGSVVPIPTLPELVTEMAVLFG